MFRLASNICLRSLKVRNLYWAFNIDDGSYYELNETAFWILKQLESNNNSDNITTKYMALYGIKAEFGDADINDALEGFLEYGLVKKEE